jgi:hypothetical protein
MRCFRCRQKCNKYNSQISRRMVLTGIRRIRLCFECLDKEMKAK